jgi:hypothetical protein
LDADCDPKFIFLPLMFTTVSESLAPLHPFKPLFMTADMYMQGLFGMNVDLLTPLRSWRWYLAFATPLLVLVFGVWIAFKYFPVCLGLYLTASRITKLILVIDREMDREASWGIP